MARRRLREAQPPQPPGDLPTGVRRQGVLPARVVPDNWINFKDVGLHYSLMPRGGPFTVQANSDEIVELVTSTTMAHYMIALVATTRDVQENLASVEHDWLVRQREVSEYLWWQPDGSWLHGRNVFGTARYPNYLAMPRVLMPNSAWEIRVRNREAVPIEFILEFRCLRQFTTEGGTYEQ